MGRVVCCTGSTHLISIDFLTRFCGMSEEAAYDAVAAQQAASAIAAKFAQQHAATEGDGPADDLASGKRKYEEDVSADPLGDEHARKRTSFTGPEGAYNGVSATLSVVGGRSSFFTVIASGRLPVGVLGHECETNVQLMILITLSC